MSDRRQAAAIVSRERFVAPMANIPTPVKNVKVPGQAGPVILAAHENTAQMATITTSVRSRN